MRLLLQRTDWNLVWLCNRRLRCRLLDLIMPRITHLGSAGATTATAAITMLLGLLREGREILQAGVAASLALAVSFGVVQLLKRSINRQRPQLVIEGLLPFKVPICPYSFPSGHTSAAFAVASATWCHQPAAGLSMLCAALLVGFSRVYLGVHFASDVLAGALIGVAFGLGAGLVF